MDFVKYSKNRLYSRNINRTSSIPFIYTSLAVSEEEYVFDYTLRRDKDGVEKVVTAGELNGVRDRLPEKKIAEMVGKVVRKLTSGQTYPEHRTGVKLI